MMEFDYAVEAKNIKNEFYNVETIVYVEGQDDIPFWELIFNKFSNRRVHIEEVGGKESLKPYIQEILDATATFIVAKDSDYDHIQQNLYNHKQIIYTKGYSIENSLIYERSLEKVVKGLSLAPERKILRNDFTSWLEQLSVRLLDLIVLDAYSYICGCGISIIPNNADRFMKSKKTYNLCPNLMNDYIRSINISIEDEKSKEILSSVKKSIVNCLDYINGHFYISAALRFITLKSGSLREKSLRDKISCSKESFFGLLLSGFECTFDERHPHYLHYQQVIEGLS